ncbi:RHS repeat-associated core domain-containing protein, partial [Pseudomonas putida]|uniref:RHS repeat-associated core domain-containing protein n=1 Tax=Pseudomonas putida TaxID=303 RepID=UPI000D46AE34
SGRLAGKAIHYRDAPAEVLPLLDKAYRYDASDNLIAEVLTQTQRRGMTNAANDENAHLEQIIGRFHDLPHTGKTYSGHNRYGYDLNEQLQTVQQSRPNWQATQVEDFKYDKAGNLFDGPKLNGLIKHNRVLVYQDKRYRYDRFGRLCEKRIGSNWVQYFEYDAEQRLVCVEQYRSGERERVVFAYDPLGRRISKEVYQRDYPEPRRRVLFHWQGLRLLQEVQSGLASLYVYATPDSYEALARIDGRPGSEEINYFHTSLPGLPEQLTDSKGRTIWRSEFRGWGTPTDEWHSQEEAREQNLKYQGQYYDREIALSYNTFRFYDAHSGHFTQPDPIGISGGANLYRYAPSTTNWIDPLGLSCNQSTPTIPTLILRLRATLRLYPKITDPRTGRSIPFPTQIDGKVPLSHRVPWGASERGAFIKGWYDRGYATPRGGWGEYDIHHIKPREYGGDNKFWNLVPVQRKTHQEMYNKFWQEYNEP